MLLLEGAAPKSNLSAAGFVELVNAVLVSGFVWNRFDSLWYFRRGGCGRGHFSYDLVSEVSPSLITLNLIIWAIFAK